ncbi:MAG: Hsp20/alpha crystallin family protein [Burkholderiales bacterium]|jgi:HSP20 family protein|nr:Hsp20/alpha crystallin family protein [Burkholderiales bacterium]
MVSSLLRFPGDVFADFDELHRQLDRVLGTRNASSSIRAVQRGSFPAVNIGVTPEAVEIFAFAPGIDPSKLDVTVDKGLLTISGERSGYAAEAGAKVNVYASERSDGAFRRVVSLPEDANPDRVNATYRNGILRIQVQKREASRPRRIEVKDAR